MGIPFVYIPCVYWKRGADQNVTPAVKKSTVLIPDEKWQYKGESAESHRYDQTIRTIDEAALNITVCFLIELWTEVYCFYVFNGAVSGYSFHINGP